VRRVFVAFALVLATAGSASAEEPMSAAPFRAKVVANVVVAKKASTGLSSIAKQAAPKSLSADEKKTWAEQSKVLAAGSARLAALKLKMDAVLAKTNAPASELAQVNLELVNTQQEIVDASQRLSATGALKARHEAVMKAMR